MDYFSEPFHFAGHYAAIYGYDNEYAYLVDTKQQGGQVKTSLESLAMARSEKGPMASNNLYYIIERTRKIFDLEEVIPAAIRNNALEYLNPPITNISYKGIAKTAKKLMEWCENSKNIEHEFRLAATMMEKAGTGGALFRNLYRDFLKESYDLLKLDTLRIAYEAFVEIALLWTLVAQLFEKVGESKDIKYVQEASEVLEQLSTKEENAMKILLTI